jgi:tripartite-type tricarboxylate transporter receptor subunit TctC
MRRIALAATALFAGCTLAACSSSSSSAPTTTSTSIATDAAGRPTCASIKAALAQQNNDVIAVALKAGGNGKNKATAIREATASAKATTANLSTALTTLLPSSVPVSSWAQEQVSYIDGLASAAAESAGTAKVNAYNVAFQASQTGKDLLANNVAIKLAVATACPSAAQG